jgi:hypothetical protein
MQSEVLTPNHSVDGKKMNKHKLNGIERADRRTAPDRRHKPADLCSAYLITGGRRRSSRRKGDKRKHLIADHYSSWLWLKLLSIYTLSLIDAYLTMLLIDLGVAEEINPVMAFYLGYGPRSFVVMKLLFTAAPLFLLCLSKDFSITKITLRSSIMIYLSIVIYEVSIVLKHSPSSLF